MRLALFQQCDEADQCFAHPPQSENTAEQWARQIQHAFENIAELVGWLEPIQQPLTLEKVMAANEWLSPGTFKQLLKSAVAGTGRKRGRPTTMRDVAIRALDLKVRARGLKKHLSWAQLPNQICPCGESKHDAKCSERIRSSARQLGVVLEKYEIQL